MLLFYMWIFIAVMAALADPSQRTSQRTSSLKMMTFSLSKSIETKSQATNACFGWNVEIHHSFRVWLLICPGFASSISPLQSTMMGSSVRLLLAEVRLSANRPP